MFFFRCFFFLFRFQLTSEVVLTYIGQTHLNKKWLKWWSSVGWLDGYQVGESGGRIQSHLWLGMNKNLSKKSYETLDAPFFCKDFQATGFFLGVLWFSFLCPEFFFFRIDILPWELLILNIHPRGRGESFTKPPFAGSSHSVFCRISEENTSIQSISKMVNCENASTKIRRWNRTWSQRT